MSCLFSDDIAVGAVARDTLAIGVTGYSHPSRTRMRGEKKLTHNYIPFFIPSRNIARRFRYKNRRAASSRLHKYGTVAVRTYGTR